MLTPFLYMYYALAVQDIGFIGIHTKPDEAEKEVDRLVNVYDTVSEKFQTEVPLINDCKQFRLFEFSIFMSNTKVITSVTSHNGLSIGIIRKYMQLL